MAFDGLGVYTPPSPQYPAVSGTVIFASDFNTIISDMATALSLCVTKDGQQTITSNLPMNTHKLTGLAAGTAAGDSIRWEQVFAALALPAGATADFTAATITVPTQVNTDNSTKAASTAFVQSVAFSAALPAQGGNADKLTTTNGAAASWTANLKDGVINFVNSADNTKKLAFDVSTVAVGTTRTATMPNKNGTLAMTSDLPATASTAKAWVMCDAAGNINSSYGVGSITDGGVGLLTVTFSSAMASANYVAVVTFDVASPALFCGVTTKLAASTAFRCMNSGGANADPSNWNCLFFGA